MLLFVQILFSVLVKEESYVGFKITYAYDDGISFGYYGCTDEDSNFSSDSKFRLRFVVLFFAPFGSRILDGIGEAVPMFQSFERLK